MIIAYPKPNLGFHVFIDEAGDFGIKPLSVIGNRKVNQWFVLGALATSSENIHSLDQWCSEIKKACDVPLDKPLHFRLLSEDKKLLACKMIAQLPVRCFVFCSLKGNMRGYRNERAAAASSDRSWFYNSCVKYLLERVTDFGLKWSIEKFKEPKHAEILLAHHPLAPISSLKSYLEREIGNIRAGKSVHKIRNMKWEVLNLGRFSCAGAEHSSGLQLADIVASAFYSCLESNSPKKSSHLPAISLKRVMWDGTLKNQRKFGFSDNGITIFPPYRPLVLGRDESEFFGKFGLDLN